MDSDCDAPQARRRLIFGTGTLHRLPFSRQRQAVLQAALEAGFRVFDVAPAYGNGLDETELGIAIRGMRNCCEINTKFGIPVKVYGAFSRHGFPMWRLADKVFRWSARAYLRRDFSVSELENSLNGSLRRLQTDFIDTLFLHEPVANLSLSELEPLLICIESLKRKGKIRKFGIAGSKDAILRLQNPELIDVFQTVWRDAKDLWKHAGEKQVILYGTYTAFRSQNTVSDLATFIKREVSGRYNAKVIVATTSKQRVRQLSNVE